MRALFVLPVLLVITGACAPPPAAAPTALALRTVRFMAGYKPQANLPFVAVYVAQTNGYFAQQGLQAEITHATGQGEHLKLLLQGTLDVITASADDVLARRADGLPVVATACLGQRDQWQAFHDSLLRFGGVSAPFQVDTAFSDLILQRIYADSRLQWP